MAHHCGTSGTPHCLPKWTGASWLNGVWCTIIKFYRMSIPIFYPSFLPPSCTLSFLSCLFPSTLYLFLSFARNENKNPSTRWIRHSTCRLWPSSVPCTSDSPTHLTTVAGHSAGELFSVPRRPWGSFLLKIRKQRQRSAKQVELLQRSENWPLLRDDTRCSRGCNKIGTWRPCGLVSTYRIRCFSRDNRRLVKSHWKSKLLQKVRNWTGIDHCPQGHCIAHYSPLAARGRRCTTWSSTLRSMPRQWRQKVKPSSFCNPSFFCFLFIFCVPLTLMVCVTHFALF